MKYFSILFLGLSLNIQAQDPLFTNSQQSLIALNPSFAGTNGLLRFQSNTRNQWYSISNTFQTYYNSIDAYIKPIKGGVAVAYTRDDQARGTLITDKIDISYAQHFSLLNEKLKIIPSVQVSYFRKTLDNTKLNFGDQIDPRRGYVWSEFRLPAKQYKSNIDLSAGLIVNYNHFYLGSSIFHITQPDEGILGPSKLPYRINVFTSYNLTLGEKVLLNALVRFESQQNFTNTYFNLNALFLKHIIISSGITSDGAINVFGGYRNNYFTISGGYEFGTSKLTGPTAGTYEISASFNLRNKENRKLVKDFERW